MKISLKTAILLLALTPILFLGTWNRHDWGDDFAQYLLQARNIVENRSQTDNGLVFPSQGDHYAVTAYPVGFPLLLAPVYAAFGLRVFPYFILLSFLLLVSGYLLFKFYNKDRPALLSVILVCAFCYNRYVLEWKWQILSDIPFLLGVVFTWAYWKPIEKSTRSVVLWGMFCGFLASIRIVGVTVPIAMMLTLFLERKPALKYRIKESLLLLLSTGSFFLLLNAIVFDVPVSGFAGFYSNALQKNSSALVTNIGLYSDLAGVFFPLPFGSHPITPWWILVALVIWMIKLIRNRSLPEIFLGVYASVLLFYPYQDGGFRFLLPILPLLIFYLSDLILLITPLSWSIRRKNISATFFILLLSSGIPEFLIRVAERPSDVIQGPQDPNGLALISQIRTNTPDSSVIAFNKPRALTLYTGRSTSNMLKNAPLEETHGQFKEMGIDYLVVSTAEEGQETCAPEFKRYLARYSSEYDTTWRCNGFLLMKKK